VYAGQYRYRSGWAEDFTALEGLACPRLQVNDAVVAHAGALRSSPGIIVILGTGSIIFAVTEQRESIRNYDFFHYASSTARHLAYETVFRIIAGQFQQEDEALVQEVLDYWRVFDIASLSQAGMKQFHVTKQECNRLLGGMGPLGYPFCLPRHSPRPHGM
jgi:glucosamine kinase